MFTRNTILGEKKEFEKGIIVATVSDIDDKNVRLNFGYDYDAVISKNEFDFDVKKDDLVHISVKSLSSSSGPVASFSDVKDYVSITLKREHYKKNLAKEALLYTSIPPIIVPPNGSPILKGSLPFPGLRKSGWHYYFEIVEPKGIVVRKDALLIPDVLFFDTPLNPEYHKKEMQEIAKKGIEIVRDYETKGFIPVKEFNNHTQDRIFIDNISIFMTLDQAEPITASKDDNYENPRTGLERDFIHLHRVRPNEAMMYANRRPSVHASGVIDGKAPESDTLENEPIIMERICDISDCDLETIEEFLRSAKLKEDTEMVLIKCRGAVENILKEIIKIDNRIDSDKYSRKTSGEILNDDYIRKLFSENIIHSMMNVIKLGNIAAHKNSDLSLDCKKVIEDTEEIFSWFKINYKKS